MEARAARFDEEDQLKKLRTQVQKQDNLLACLFLFSILEGSRKKCQAKRFECN